MSRLQLSNIDMGSVGKVVNLAAPTADGDAVRKVDLDNAALGRNWKDDAVAASTANINLSAPGSTIDGVTMTNGDRFLAKNQSTAAQNGIYIWNGAASAATRAPDANTADSLTEAVVTIGPAGSTNGGTSWRSSVAVVTLGTDTVTFVSFGAATPVASTSSTGTVTIADQSTVDAGVSTTTVVTPAGLAATTLRLKKYTTTFGDGAATTFTITHNLGTRAVDVTVYNSSTYDEVDADVNHATTNTVTIATNGAPSSGAYTVVVIG